MPAKTPQHVSDTILKEYLGGLSSYQLAKKNGMSRSTIRIILHQAGVKMRGPRKVSDEIQSEIVQAYINGAGTPELGRRFGFNWTTCLNIVKAHGVPVRETKGKEFGRRVSAALQGISLDEWTGYSVSPWKHFIVQPEYVDWRKAVYTRDKYICFDCKKRGGRLEAHHIHRKSLFPHMALLVENGVTLCKKCHEAIKGKEAENASRYLVGIGSGAHPLIIFEEQPKLG